MWGGPCTPGHSFVWPEGPFLRPDLSDAERRAQARSSRHRRRRRAAGLTARARRYTGWAGAAPTGGRYVVPAVSTAPAIRAGLAAFARTPTLTRPRAREARCHLGG